MPTHMHASLFRLAEVAYLLKTSKACLGEGGMVHLGVADCVGQ